jgi:acetyl-CoA C-acetyltransferase
MTSPRGIEVVIVAARRTPQGRFLAALAGMSAVDLAVAAGESALAGIAPGTIDQVIVGNVLSAGAGMNPARQITLRLGLPQETPAFTVNMMCASGMQAVILAAQAIRAGDADAVLCGGTESMSQARFLVQRTADNQVAEDAPRVDALLRDGLVDPLGNEHMGVTAERLATRYHLTRQAQDTFAQQSHLRQAAAQTAGRFTAELVPLPALAKDEHPRPNISLEKLATLKPAFAADGTVTPGNASGINDGAAMLVLASADAARRHGWTILARLTAATAVGCDPAVMGLGPVHALRRLQARHGIDVAACDTIELNEAFAAQSLACIHELGLDPARVNPDGGAIALGHPIGASGARIIAHLAQRTAAGISRNSVAAVCVGGGMGVAVALSA